MHQPAKIRLLSLLSGLLFVGNSYAAEKMKSGLWEMTMQSDAIKSMPKIPQEQLEQMKKMGIKMPVMENGAMVQQICVTKEMAAQDQPLLAQKEQSACQPRNLVQSGSTYSMDLICDSPELKGTGKVKGSYNGNDSLRSSYDFKGTSYERPVSQHMETTGKWLSSNCGEVKPVADWQKKK